METYRGLIRLTSGKKIFYSTIYCYIFIAFFKSLSLIFHLYVCHYNSTSPFQAGSSSQTASQPKTTDDIQSNYGYQFQINQKSSFRTEDNRSFKVAKNGNSRAPTAIYLLYIYFLF